MGSQSCSFEYDLLYYTSKLIPSFTSLKYFFSSNLKRFPGLPDPDNFCFSSVSTKKPNRMIFFLKFRRSICRSSTAEYSFSNSENGNFLPNNSNPIGSYVILVLILFGYYFDVVESKVWHILYVKPGGIHGISSRF